MRLFSFSISLFSLSRPFCLSLSFFPSLCLFSLSLFLLSLCRPYSSSPLVSNTPPLPPALACAALMCVPGASL